MAKRAGLFDLRGVLALLFAVYGVVLTVMGLFATSEEDLRKSGDINVNLWMGVGMLVTAALFGLWQRLRPLAVPEEAPQEAPADTER
jgi:drug/metabolite transporter (DMT)-like permease